MCYGVGVLTIVEDVAVLIAMPPGVAVEMSVPGADGVLFVCVSGQANRSTGKSVQVLPLVQILSVMDVNSGPLQSTTCLPLFTSTVEQLVVSVVDGDTTSKVAVSGKTSRACAMVSTQN